MLQNKTALKWIIRLGLVNAVIILYLRAGLVYQPLLFNFYYESHGNKEWVNKIREEVGDIPVVFENSYRNAPMYAFYSNGIPTFSLNNIMYRKNQYSIDDSEERMRGKKVAYISKYTNKGTFSFTKANGQAYKGKYISNFNSYRKLECVLDADKISLNKEDYSLEVINPYNFDIELSRLKFSVAYLDHYKNTMNLKPVQPNTSLSNIETLKAKDTTNFDIKIPLPKDENVGYIRIVISENNLYSGLNGKPIPVE